MANYSDPIALVRAANALLDGALLNGQPYIRSIKGGKQHSPQGMAEGMQVVFVIEFEVSDDRSTRAPRLTPERGRSRLLGLH